MLRHAVFAAAWLAFSVALHAQNLPCAEKDPACWHRALREHEVHRLAFWQHLQARPLLDRVQAAPPALVQYVQWDNIANGWSERPRASSAPPAFIAEVKAALADLPPEVDHLFTDKLAGIFLVDDLGGTGYTDVIDDDSGHPVAGYIVLDAAVLQSRRANEWATWKEASPFRALPGWRIEARIETAAQDTTKQAIQYILLHELGHVLSIGRNVHPPWTISAREAGATDGYPFFSLSWRIAGDSYVSLYDEAFPLRGQIAYYMGAKLKADEARQAYSQLERTNFPTLYAATRPGDDFAESFANYVHVVMMKRPWQVTLGAPDGDEVQVGPCWDEPRCADKRRLLERILGLH